MSLRTPGAAPFHLRVSFHAFPGQELLGPGERPAIITGDGTYEETWLSLHEWRREVKFAGYHAVEVDSGGVRKMQASSDYEPGRVLLLLKDLLVSIPRDLASEEYESHGSWTIDSVKAGETSLVRITRTMYPAQVSDLTRAALSDTFYFQHNGYLVLQNRWGLVAFHEGLFTFAGRTVAKHIAIKAVDRDLLTADVAIESAPPGAALSQLAGAPADPGDTLLPIQDYQVRKLALPNMEWNGVDRTPERAIFSYQMVIDRSGRPREVEVIYATNVDEYMRFVLPHLREDRMKPVEIDGSKCELLENNGFLPLAGPSPH